MHAIRTAVLCVAAALVAVAMPRAAPTPAVSIWYRGVPAGVPRQDDLAAIRALGFTSITWPIMSVAHVADLRKQADAVGLYVDIRIEPVPLTAESARHPRGHVDIDVSPGAVTHAAIGALAWRAVAHGAVVIGLDPGPADGTGLTDATGVPHAWVADALALARQLEFNARVFEAWTDGPAVSLDDPVAPGLEVLLRQDERSWYLVATNASAAPAHAVAHLPAGVPAALWVDLVDGSMMSMLSRSDGPRWTFDLAGGAARIYVIDKHPHQDR